MEAITIMPADHTQKVRVEAINVLNEFKVLGFDSRSKFINVVVQVLPEYENYKRMQELYAFWQTRVFSQEVNTRLARVVEQLKAE